MRSLGITCKYGLMHADQGIYEKRMNSKAERINQAEIMWKSTYVTFQNASLSHFKIPQNIIDRLKSKCCTLKGIACV